MPTAPRSGSSHPTQADVARHAGVSRALVSIVFRDQPGASQANRDHVRAVAAELGYVPDPRAQQLSRRRTGVVGVSYGLTQDFHSTVVEHLYACADEVGFALVLSGSGASRPEDAAIDSLLAHRCEGLVLVGPACDDRTLAMLGSQLPTVVVFRSAGSTGAGSVRTDDVAGSAAATGHLIELGHRRLVQVDGAAAPGALDRSAGFTSAVQGAGATAVAILRGGTTEADGMRAGRELVELLGRADPPTGVVVFNDHCAVGLMAAVRSAGFRIPADLSVIGFDDDRLAAVPGLDLTTMRQDSAALAGHAMQQLAERAIDPTAPPREVVVRAELVVRSTTAAPPAR